jgi:Flp pilus assembly protein TadB
MIDWGVVAAYVTPLIAAIGLAATWFTWQQRKRDTRVAAQISAATSALELEQRLTRERLAQMEATLEQHGRTLEQQAATFTQALVAIGRIEGRLAGPLASQPGA